MTTRLTDRTPTGWLNEWQHKERPHFVTAAATECITSQIIEHVLDTSSDLVAAAKWSHAELRAIVDHIKTHSPRWCEYRQQFNETIQSIDTTTVYFIPQELQNVAINRALDHYYLETPKVRPAAPSDNGLMMFQNMPTHPAPTHEKKDDTMQLRVASWANASAGCIPDHERPERPDNTAELWQLSQHHVANRFALFLDNRDSRPTPPAHEQALISRLVSRAAWWPSHVDVVHNTWDLMSRPYVHAIDVTDDVSGVTVKKMHLRNAAAFDIEVERSWPSYLRDCLVDRFAKEFA